MIVATHVALFGGLLSSLLGDKSTDVRLRGRFDLECVTRTS